jgi:hypothetical protein
MVLDRDQENKKSGHSVIASLALTRERLCPLTGDCFEFLYATALPLSLPAACSMRAATAFGCEK